MKKLMFSVLFLISYQFSIAYTNQFKEKTQLGWNNSHHLFITNETKENHHEVELVSDKNDQIFKILKTSEEIQLIPTIVENIKQNELTRERRNENFTSSTPNANTLTNIVNTIDPIIKPEKEKSQNYSTIQENVNINFKIEHEYENSTNFNTSIKNLNTTDSTITTIKIAELMRKRRKDDDPLKFRLESFDDTNTTAAPFPSNSYFVQPANKILLNALSFSLIYKLIV